MKEFTLSAAVCFIGLSTVALATEVKRYVRYSRQIKNIRN